MKSPCQVEAGQLTSCADKTPVLRAHWAVQGGHSQCPILAALGGTYANPLVNVPEVAILALGR